jgi:hypothetical protein
MEASFSMIKLEGIWLKGLLKDNDIDALFWPPKRADLSPIIDDFFCEIWHRSKVKYSEIKK